MLGLAAPAQAELTPGGKRVALVIGNGQYRSVDRLANAPNDARLIAATLKSLGFTLVGDGPQVDLDRAHFSQAVEEFGRALAGAEVGLFYYSGHGLQVQGTNWLVPVDANPTRPQDLDFQMVDADLVLRQMDGAGTKLNLVLLDACRNNPFASRGLRAIQAGLAEMRAPEGTLISYATQPGAVAADGAGADSPYTTALAASMRQPGLDIFRLFNQVGLQVKRDTGGNQQPWVSSSPIDGDFYFAQPPVPPSPPPVQVAGLARPPEPPAPPPDPAERLRALALAQRCAVLDTHRDGREIVVTGVAVPGTSLDALFKPASAERGLFSLRSEVELLPAFACDVVTALTEPLRQTRAEAGGAILILPRREYAAREQLSVLVRGGAGKALAFDLYHPGRIVQHLAPTLVTQEGPDARAVLPLEAVNPSGPELLGAILSSAKPPSERRPRTEPTEAYLASLTSDPALQADLASFTLRAPREAPKTEPTKAALTPPRPAPAARAGNATCARILERAQISDTLSEPDRAILAQCH